MNFLKNSKEDRPNLALVFLLNNQFMTLRFLLDDSRQDCSPSQLSHIEIKSEHSKIYLNSFQKHLKDTKKQLPFCQEAHTAKLLTIIYNE